MNKEHWQDWFSVLLGLWVAVTPWVFGATHGAVVWSFLVVGLVVIALAASEISAFQPWKEWAIAALGTWVLLSPRILEFTGAQDLTWNAVVSGLLLVAFAGWAIGDAHEILPRISRPEGDLRGNNPGIAVPDEHEHMAGQRARPSETGPDVARPGVGTQSPGQASHE